MEARFPGVTDFNLGLQRLVADLATRLSAIDPTAIDAAIVDSLRQIGEALQLDWAILCAANNGDAPAPPTHHWVRSTYAVPGAFSITSLPFVIAHLQAGKPCCWSTSETLPDLAIRELCRQHQIRSAAIFPVASAAGEGALTALAFGSMTYEQEWTPVVVELLRLVAGTVSQVCARNASHRALQDALDEIRRIRDRMASEKAEYRREVQMLRTSHPTVCESAVMQQVLAQIEQVAPTPATVLLLGETGTGKELMAGAIHELSPRRQRRMIRVSCAALPTALIESELFGRERGAYTGALSRQIGRFEAAHESTLFLDEIGELPMEVQVKLLRALQDGVIERLGSTQSIQVDVRIIAATNRNLEDAVRDKTFREDLFYRLNVFPVVVPPLRERIEDIPGLVWTFINEFSTTFAKPIDSISKESLRELQKYQWPGNVRELRNVIERAVILGSGRHLVVPAPQLGNNRPLPGAGMTLSALEVAHIKNVLESTDWRVRGVGGAAERLGLKPTTLESRMAKLGIARKKAR